MNELLVRYDVRELCFSATRMWPDDRSYLLRYDVGKLLSVDTIVWPSIFDTGQGAGLYASERIKSGLSVTYANEWVGPNHGLWENLTEMLDVLSSRAAGATCSFRIVAVTCFPQPRPGPNWPPYILGSFDPGNQWHALGYDVADSSQMSGLTGCGYTPKQAVDLAARWGERLNAHHLFADPNEADLFRRLTDRRVPEHRPFHVYGLWEYTAGPQPIVQAE